jgi:hypothetical protein
MKTHARTKYSRRVSTNNEFADEVSRDLVDNYSSDCSGKKFDDNNDKYERREEYKIYVVDMMQQE